MDPTEKSANQLTGFVFVVGLGRKEACVKLSCD